MRSLIIFLVALLAACGRIESGNVGVRTDFNKNIEAVELQSGWYGAFFTSVNEYVTKETQAEFADLTPKAKDNLSLQDLDVSVFYTVNSTNVAELVIKYSGMTAYVDGLHYPGYGLVERISRGAIYDAVATLDSLTMHTKRGYLEEEIKKRVQSDLDASDKGSFIITKVIVRNLTTDQALEAAIRQAVQVQKQIEAKQNEIKLAEAEAERKRVEAGGTARANAILASSLTDQYLRYRQIEAQEKFAGQGTHTVLMGGNAIPLIGINK